jgi:hypothetical protein
MSLDSCLGAHGPTVVVSSRWTVASEIEVDEMLQKRWGKSVYRSTATRRSGTPLRLAWKAAAGAVANLSWRRATWDLSLHFNG